MTSSIPAGEAVSNYDPSYHADLSGQKHAINDKAAEAQDRFGVIFPTHQKVSRGTEQVSKKGIPKDDAPGRRELARQIELRRSACGHLAQAA